MKAQQIALATALLLASGCGDDDGTPADAGPPADANEIACAAPDILLSHEEIGATPGVARTVRLDYAKDFCRDATIALSSSDEGVATVPASIDIGAEESQARFEITAAAEGTATITATWEIQGATKTDSLQFIVTDGTIPDCSGSASGTVSYGGRVEVTDGSAAGAFVALQEGAERDDRWHAEEFDVAIGCADDQIPDGFRKLGPAIAFGPAHQRFMREIPFAIPVDLSVLPEGAHRGHVEVSYTGPGVAEPRVVPVAVTHFEGGARGLLGFEAPRLGTYQAVARDSAGESRMRDFTFRAITGFSMGGSGTGLIGFHNAERFDFVAPLGAAWDWVYMLDYIRKYHLGGFCTEDERVADPEGCAAGASIDRVPPPTHVNEHVQDFEHWWYDDDARGQGATFDRESYIDIFQDLSHQFGNPNTDRSLDPTEPNITAAGIPDSRRERPHAEACDDPVIIPPYDGSAGTGYFDDEYNPDGTYQVVSVCDGREIRIDGERDVGVWDPDGDHDRPLLVAMAVDIDGDGERGPGEPIVRAQREPYRDCGLDGVCNVDEDGYDPVENPDPAGDDYDYQYNPAGTENNWLRDGDPCGEGEDYDDVGLDGVAGTAQLDEGGFDSGEGNGCHDMASGAERMRDFGPRHLVLNADAGALRDTDVFADGGIRDLFLAGVACSHTAGAFPARGMPMRYHNGHPTLHLDGRGIDGDFVFTEVNWDEVGKNVLVRYGNPDATPGAVEAGDGQHAGSNEQLVARMLSGVAWMSARWPGGDKRRVQDRICANTTEGCENVNQILLEFTSPTTGRVGESSIILPPGYFEEEYADYEYPVVYMLHGYGMEPEDLMAIGVLFWNFMTAPTIPAAQRLQKMILVIPDGFCRGDECVRGTFYADAPESSPGAAQMETYMLDLMDYVDANFRTRGTEAHEVID